MIHGDVALWGGIDRAGHPNCRRIDVLYFNPGGAGPRHFTRPIMVGRLQVGECRVTGKIIELPV
jgi:hypothetical protein